MRTNLKRPRLALNSSSARTARISLTSLPIEILAEILLYTCSPPTVLAVSRTCSFLYRSLAQNPDASFIWRGVRKTCEPVPLPDPGDGWKKSEADYATFVFGGGVCEVCRKTTRAMYVSFATRIRLCGNWHCQRRFLDEFLVNITSDFQGQNRQSLWVPCVESTRCFYPSRQGASIWPHNDILVRKSDWEEFQRELQAYGNPEQAQAERKHAAAPTSRLAVLREEHEQRERIFERFRVAIQRFPQIMEVSIRLARWKWDYDREHKIIKRLNDMWTKDLAEHEGWDLGSLVASQAYGSLQRRKTFLLEKIEWNDVSPIRATIESELLTMQARHKRQKAEATYGENLTEVRKIYERMRCGTLGVALTGASGSSDPLVLPPLSVFCTLPSVRALKGSPDPSALPPSSTSVTSDITSSLAISLITTDIHTWLIPAQKHLMTLLGYPNGWQSASTRTLPPLKRVTARFFCRRCGEGNVGRGYQRERCLDFKGVCSHVCVAAPGRRHQEVPQESEIEVNTSDRNGQERGKGRGKKKSGGRTSDWKVDVFEKDEKAISLIKTVLALTGLSEEDPSTVSTLNAKGGIIRCMTCKGWIVMDFDTAIGHAHRHESVQIQLLPTSAPSYVGFAKKDGSAPNAFRPIPNSRLAFERGTSELLLGPSCRARNLCGKVNYGCKHCFAVILSNVVVVIQKAVKGKGPRAMDFNGLRSHVKEKHGIQEIRDEDFFCYTRIGGENGEG